MTKPQDDAPLASRSGTSNPLGKCTEDLRTKVPYAIKDGICRLANEVGMSEAEYLRDLLMVHVLGIDVVTKIQQDRINRFAGMGQEKA